MKITTTHNITLRGDDLNRVIRAGLNELFGFVPEDIKIQMNHHFRTTGIGEAERTENIYVCNAQWESEIEPDV